MCSFGSFQSLYILHICASRWLLQVERNVHETVTEETNLSWAAYHASEQCNDTRRQIISGMFPLFSESSNSLAMMRHSMMVIKKSVDFVNPGQTPVITADQPLYALLKQSQWTWPDQYGEDKFVIVLGGLHQEMAAYKVLGHWLKDSGWIEALDESKVATPGTAESFLTGSNVSKTRHAHEVTACTLFTLIKRAYDDYIASDPPGPIETLDIFKARRMEESPQFQYWCLMLELELNALQLVKSFREGNFNLYIASMMKLVPWYFALDLPNYARWTSVHISDMETLYRDHPDVHTEFQKGNFVVKKSARLFSMLALDQAHKQNNAVIKGDGGAVGLLTNSQALLKWMTSVRRRDG